MLRASRLRRRLHLVVVPFVVLVVACGSDAMVNGYGASGDGSPDDDGAVGDGAFGDGHGDGPTDAEAYTDGRGATFVEPFLGAASRFAVVAGGSVTNANITTITGDLGVYPSTTPIGPSPPTVNGTSFLGTPEALAAQNAMTASYNQLMGEPCETNLSGKDLGGMTLTPGVYCFDSSAQLTGTLTLDGSNGTNHHGWVFQVGSALTTATIAVVKAVNGANVCDAYWKIGSSATLGTGTKFGGSIVAMASITLNTGSSVVGRVLGRSGSVTLDTNTVSVASCPVEHIDGGD